MQPIQHTVKKIKQGTSECLQTAATQSLSFFDLSVTVEEVLAQVPVYVESGKK